jgi:hypothetical protein
MEKDDRVGLEDPDRGSGAERRRDIGGVRLFTYVSARARASGCPRQRTATTTEATMLMVAVPLHRRSINGKR